MKKSTITCDMEGRILTMNDGAVQIFGYSKEEIIGKKRVSLFSPGEIVLQNVAGWLEEAVKKGEYVGKTYFLNKNKEKINAKIRITPTFANGKDKAQTGYCGVTEVINDDVEVPINFSTKLIKGLAITRMPFTSASILPIFAVGAYFAGTGDNLFNITNFILCLLGVMIAHLSSNVLNDYFDVKDGTDEENSDYFQQVSGGSRAIELGLITLNGTKKLGFILTTIALIIGGIILFSTNPANINSVIICALAGLFLGYFYTAPPLRLVARKGLGELTIFLTFGPLITLGTAFAIFDGDLASTEHLINCLYIGIPMGLLTTNILLINEFPDMESDQKTHKNHLVVTFGKENSRWIYLFILVLSILFTYILATKIENTLILISLGLLLIYGGYIFSVLYNKYNSRELVSANWGTIAMQAVYCIIICLTLIF
jgi:1,4-dihydroxy-2-naphthoate octaprenyltransferase